MNSNILKLTFSKNLTVPIVFFLLALILFDSCAKDSTDQSSKSTEEYSADFILSYYDQICKTVKTTPGFFPPQASRAYGYIGIAQYEAVVNGIENAKSLQNQLNGFASFQLPAPLQGQLYNWAIASNAATARMMKYMFDKNLTPANRLKIDSLELYYHTQLSLGEEISIVSRSQAYGQNIADVVYNYSKTDGGHESYLDPFQLPYSVPSDPYCWVPTGAITTPLSPRWGNNRPFLISNIQKVQPPKHMAFSTATNSEFYKEAMIVYNTVTNNTSEQIEIAKYWADDPFATCTPAGHTFNILAQILKEERATLAKSSLAFAKMSLAENDAFISCWKGKYDYILIRPVSYIQKYIDANFKTVIGTPPFPAYTSGHSCEMGAGSRIFSSLFTNGSGDYQFTDYSQLQYGFFARSYSNFDEMAQECANSRLYGGIHYPIDNSKGLQVGKAIGDNVNKEIIWPLFVR
jgi:hypothetical protein